MSKQGQLFTPDTMKQVRKQFCYVDHDPVYTGRRLYFDNAGGAYRLKKTVEAFSTHDCMPDCPERAHKTSICMKQVITQGEQDIRTILGAHEGGSLFMMLSASQVSFGVTGVIAENVVGSNIVTTALEHPSVYDAVSYYCQKTGKELRTAATNPVTGGVDVAEIVKLIDQNTCMLSVIYASNITGAVQDIKAIIAAARTVKPDLYIYVDAVQHMPHGTINVDELGLDGVVFSPYKLFGVRGSGIGYVSDRVAALPHHRLLGKDQTNWKLGTSVPAHYAALSQIVDYICWLGGCCCGQDSRDALYAAGMGAIKSHEQVLMERMLNGSGDIAGLRQIDGVQVLFDHEDWPSRDFILAADFPGRDLSQVVAEYERHGII
ncbi:MAG: aminotransferase class V-fold PLP-dependent enzyme, partial [Bacillota bacterium]|nr:aminotransferase class V-fold PLP-dependent enzyme [Bacillota bacterium]